MNIAAAVGWGGGGEGKTVIGRLAIKFWFGEKVNIRETGKKRGKTETEKRPIRTRQLTPVNLSLVLMISGFLHHGDVPMSLPTPSKSL